MGKHVVTTVQTIVRQYYVKVDDPTWAEDGIVMGELEEFSQNSLTEDIVSVEPVKKWPKQPFLNVNGAVMEFDYENHKWRQTVRWDLAKREGDLNEDDINW